MSIDDMAVYIANLGDYVEGGVKGAWFRFPLNEEEIRERIGLNGRYEEYAIHDTENFPMKIEEYTSIDELNRIYELIQDFPEEVLDKLDDFVSYYGSVEELADHIDDIICYSGCNSMEDVACLIFNPPYKKIAVSKKKTNGAYTAQSSSPYLLIRNVFCVS